MLVHAFLLTLFVIFNIRFFIINNLLSVAFYLFVIKLIRIRKYKYAFYLISLEVVIYATISGILLGIDTYIIGYYLLVIIMQFIIPCGEMKQRFAIIAAVVVCITVCIFISTNMPPPPRFSDALRRIFLISNIYILTAGTVTELLIGAVINRILDNFNRLKMAELTSQANTDPLTSLYNRRYAEYYFKEALNEKSRYCVAMIDIDDFKRINDAYGHSVGDEVLRFISSFLTGNLRKSDVLFSWGGEEFLLVLDNVDIKTAQSILEKIRKGIEESRIITVRGVLRITVTIGASIPEKHNFENGIELSDRNLYAGKSSGKNKVVV
jgi:diguanylate cyclase (GGDEF)-like protein